MKKTPLFIFSGICFSALSQDISKNAIELRIGDNNGIGTEVSYQRHLTNRT